MRQAPIFFAFFSLSCAPFADAQEQNADQAPASATGETAPLNVPDIIQDLTSVDAPKRGLALKKFNEWAEANPLTALEVLIPLISESPEPEVRERAMRVMKKMAIAEYEQFGEGYCGVQMSLQQDMIEVPGKGKLSAVELSFVTKNGPAEKAGLAAGDKIVSIDGKTQKETKDHMENVRLAIRNKGAGKTVVIGIVRDNKYLDISVKLTRRPPNLDQLQAGNGMMMFGGGNLQFGGNFQLGGNFNQEGMDEMIEKDKNSDAFFAEWLDKKRNSMQEKQPPTGKNE